MHAPHSLLSKIWVTPIDQMTASVLRFDGRAPDVMDGTV